MYKWRKDFGEQLLMRGNLFLKELSKPLKINVDKNKYITYINKNKVEVVIDEYYILNRIKCSCSNDYYFKVDCEHEAILLLEIENRNLLKQLSFDYSRFERKFSKIFKDEFPIPRKKSSNDKDHYIKFCSKFENLIKYEFEGLLKKDNLVLSLKLLKSILEKIFYNDQYKYYSGDPINENLLKICKEILKIDDNLEIFNVFKEIKNLSQKSHKIYLELNKKLIESAVKVPLFDVKNKYILDMRQDDKENIKYWDEMLIKNLYTSNSKVYVDDDTFLNFNRDNKKEYLEFLTTRLPEVEVLKYISKFENQKIDKKELKEIYIVKNRINKKLGIFNIDDIWKLVYELQGLTLELYDEMKENLNDLELDEKLGIICKIYPANSILEEILVKINDDEKLLNYAIRVDNIYIDDDYMPLFKYFSRLKKVYPEEIKKYFINNRILSIVKRARAEYEYIRLAKYMYMLASIENSEKEIKDLVESWKESYKKRELMFKFLYAFV